MRFLAEPVPATSANNSFSEEPARQYPCRSEQHQRPTCTASEKVSSWRTPSLCPGLTSCRSSSNPRPRNSHARSTRARRVAIAGLASPRLSRCRSRVVAAGVAVQFAGVGRTSRAPISGQRRLAGALIPSRTALFVAVARMACPSAAWLVAAVAQPDRATGCSPCIAFHGVYHRRGRRTAP